MINNTIMIARKYTAEDVACLFGCTIEQARAQYARNARSLLVLERRAQKTGRWRGLTVDQWQAARIHAESQSL